MPDKDGNELFTVMWRVSPKTRLMRGQYHAKTLAGVLRILDSAERVNTASCCEIVIHHHQGPGIVEVFAHDSDSNVTHINPVTPKQREIDALHRPKLNKKERRVLRRKEEAEARNKTTANAQKTILIGAALLLDSLKKDPISGKPHVRLPAATEPPSVVAAYGLYRAYKA